MLFVHRDIVTIYKQTILGPFWFIVQPLLTSFTQFIIFGKIAEIPSDGVPYFLFVLAGNTMWFYFRENFTITSTTFKTNQGLFGKVYFPRVIIPLSVTISSLAKFLVQFVMFLGVYFYISTQSTAFHLNIYVLLIPILLFTMALLAMGFGMIISSLTVKYRDFSFLVSFGVGLYMYITPVVYPTSLVIEKVPASMANLIYLNPLTGVFDLFRYSFFSQGAISWEGFAYSIVFSISIFFLGLMIFNRTEKNVMDTI